MADYIDEFAVKVNADTKDLTKELKKLRRSFKDLFNTKATNKEMAAFEKELKDIARLPFNPFKDWNSELLKTERVLKRVGAKTIKDQIKDMRKLIREHEKSYKNGPLKDLPEDTKKGNREGMKARLRKLQKERWLYRHKYESDPENAARNYMEANYTKEEWEKAEAYITKKKVDDHNNKWFKNKYGTLKDARARYNSEVKAGKKPDDDLKEYIGGKWKKTAGYSSEDKKKYSDMWKEYEAFKKRQKQATDSEAEGKKGILGRTWDKIKGSIVHLWRIFKRYIGYQLIKNFFGNIEQGMQNLYQWSKYNKKEWADVLDKSKSMSTALSNAFALAKTYLTLWITKVFTGIKEVFVNILNDISKFVAWISGAKTYVQANKDIMTRWADNNADTKQLIQGFDKLNVWKGNDNTQPKDMFTEYSWDEDRSWLGKLFHSGTPVKEVGKTIGKQVAESFITYVLSSDPTYIGGAGAYQQTEESKGIWQRTKEVFAGLWQGIWEGIKSGWGKVKEWFNGIFNKIKTWWNGVTDEDEGENGEIITRQVEPGFKHALKEWFAGVWEKVSGFFVGLWNEKLKPWFTEAWNKIKKWFDESIEPFMTRLADTLAKWWQNRKKTTQYEVEDWVYDKTGAVIDIEDTLRQFKRLMPWNWGKDLSEEVKFNAAGGVYTSPALGVVGEASSHSNPELITPTALLDDRLQANNSELLGAMNGMINNVIGAINGVNMEVKIGDDVIARSASRGNNAYYKQTGRPLIR